MLLVHKRNTVLRGYFNKSEIYMGVSPYGIQIGKRRGLRSAANDMWCYYAECSFKEIFIPRSAFLTDNFFKTIYYIHTVETYADLVRLRESMIDRMW